MSICREDGCETRSSAGSRYCDSHNPAALPRRKRSVIAKGPSVNKKPAKKASKKAAKKA